MLLLLDAPGIARLLPSKGTSRLGNQRTYFAAAAPARAIIVFHRGLNARRLAGQVVEAHVTTAVAPPGLARPGNAGKLHTIVSVWRPVLGLADQTLSRMIAEGQRDLEFRQI